MFFLHFILLVRLFETGLFEITAYTHFRLRCGAVGVLLTFAGTEGRRLGDLFLQGSPVNCQSEGSLDKMESSWGCQEAFACIFPFCCLIV